MKVWRDFPHVLPVERDLAVVAIGVFDGVHRGHQALLGAAFDTASGRNVAVVTFDPHPRAVLGPPKPRRLLSPLEERLDLLAAWPLAAVAVLRFDAEIAQQSYEDFVRRALFEGLGARCLVLGAGMRLGHARAGTPEKLAALGSRLGFQVLVVPPVEVDGEIASSTRIRHLLDGGDVESAARVLGRAYALSGTVVRGAGRGRTLGVPTANLEVVGDKLIPGHGVYAAWARVDTGTHAAAVNIGTAPTFTDAGRRSVEAHLLDFEADLYGCRVELRLVRRLRDERRFDSGEDLRSQIEADITSVRVWARSTTPLSGQVE